MISIKYSNIVRQLVDVLAEDRDLCRQVREALRDRDEQPGDIWSDMTLEGFLRFFDEWLSCMPVIEDEQSFLDDFLKLHRTAKGLTLVKETPFAQWLNRFTIARGEFLDSSASMVMIPHWADHPDIDLSQFIVPDGEFTSFNDFFTRRLQPGARPIAAPDDDSVVVSPADSELQGTLALDRESLVEVKGMSLCLADLLGGEPLADRFSGGIALVHFLGVEDYHRFHSPVTGRIVKEAKIGGLCFGCDEYPGEFFTEHHRGFFMIETADHGLVGMVTVGIATVSSVQHLRSSGDVVRKGDELGYFAYGGSAILLLFRNGQVCLDDFEKETHVLMGSRIGSFAVGSAERAAPGYRQSS